MITDGESRKMINQLISCDFHNEPTDPAIFALRISDEKSNKTNYTSAVETSIT